MDSVRRELRTWATAEADGLLVGPQCGVVGGGGQKRLCQATLSAAPLSPGQSRASSSEQETQTCGWPEVFLFLI